MYIESHMKKLGINKMSLKFEVGKPDILFDCKWGVYTRNGHTSVCYCTDRERAQIITDALNAYSKQILKEMTK